MAAYQSIPGAEAWPETLPLPRLSLKRLRDVPRHVRRPRFDPAELTPGILHLGCGSFHRAHQALLTQQAIEAELDCTAPHRECALPPWGIVTTSLVSPRTTRALAEQDGLYTILERGPTGTRATVVGTLCQVLYAPEEPLRLQAAFADPAIRIVTVTVTVAGYCTDPVTGRLDAGHPEIQADLRRAHPRTAVGVLVDGLRQRYRLGVAPPVVMSCDNLPANGRVLRRMCLDFASLQDDALADWIERHVQFPATMADRIVPMATGDDREDAQALLGLSDAVPVSAEPFRQWIIEHFHGPRPRWEAAGAEYVPDVTAWEASKLRLLNGGHLAIACLGALAGCSSVADAMAVPGFTAYALRFMLDEQKPTLPPSDHDIDAYARQLLARWRNSSISHQLDRVRRDGSAKLPTRLLTALRINREAGRPAPCSLLAVAAWIACANGRNDTGGTILPLDHLGDELRARAAAAGRDPGRLVDSLLELTEVFGEDLPRDAALRRSLVQAVAALQERGARGAVAACVAGRLFDGF